MKKNTNIRSVGAIFRRAVKGENFMTPTVIQYQWAGDYVVELSTGEAMDGSEMFGVTVVDPIANAHRHDLSRVFSKRTLARAYINRLAQI